MTPRQSETPRRGAPPPAGISDVARSARADAELQALRASDERFRQIAASVDHVFWVIDLLPTPRVSYVSPAFERIWGYPAEAVYADRALWLDRMHPDDRTTMRRAMEDWIAAPQSYRYAHEYRIVRADGRTRWISDRGQAVRDADGSCYRLTGVAEDITERKRAERELADKRAQLDAAFTHLNDGLIIVLRDGSVPVWNHAALRMFGYASTAEVQAPLRELSLLVELCTLDGTPVPFEDWQLTRALRGEPIVQRAARLRHKVQGWEKVCAYSVTPVEDADGRVQCAILQISDITERHRHDEEIRRLHADLERRVVERTASLEAANRELEAFSYSVSHDLRAPLRALDGFAEVLQREHGDTLPHSGRHHLDIIRQSAQSMGRLIDDLLSFARLGRRPLAKVDIDTTLLVRQALRTLAPLQQDRRIDLRIGELPASHGDPAMLQQIWVNLLGNALKYSRRRDPALIEIGARRLPEGPEFYVRDNGVGFAEKDAERLFTAFERLHEGAEYEGSGVGLAIVQRIVQRHGGKVRAEGAIDVGACFSFTLGPGAAPAPERPRTA
ncbi:MAG: PAS domain S-box protein [Proteobacteria bacterium]|nr:PAS domain S-box protein [Pseudomonadota bacterium]